MYFKIETVLFQIVVLSLACVIYSQEAIKYGEMTDVEGNLYKTVQIGNQVWMAENLKTVTYNDGTKIPIVTSNSVWAESYTTKKAACSFSSNDTTNRNIYGTLYNWHCVNSGKLAPAGYRIPTSEDWKELVAYLGGNSIAGGKLKSKKLWLAPNTGASNSTGFSALPGGDRNYQGPFYDIGKTTFFWTTTEYNEEAAIGYGLARDVSRIEGADQDKCSGFYLRCVKVK